MRTYPGVATHFGVSFNFESGNITSPFTWYDKDKMSPNTRGLEATQ